MPSIRFKSLALALPVLLLAGCGDGWEMVPYKGFPYDNARTAGSGVAYVRVHMLQEKGPVVESVKTETKIEIPVPPPAPQMTPVPPSPPQENAEEMFNKSQRK